MVDTPAPSQGRTLGSLAFASFLSGANPTGKPISVREAARVLECTKTMICRYRDGRDTPPAWIREAIKRWTNGAILCVWWRTQREKDGWAKAKEVKPLTVAA
jgi:hypothetical protein